MFAGVPCLVPPIYRSILASNFNAKCVAGHAHAAGTIILQPNYTYFGVFLQYECWSNKSNGPSYRFTSPDKNAHWLDWLLAVFAVAPSFVAAVALLQQHVVGTPDAHPQQSQMIECESIYLLFWYVTYYIN